MRTSENVEESQLQNIVTGTAFAIQSFSRRFCPKPLTVINEKVGLGALLKDAAMQTAESADAEPLG